jgi:hypothetical protein
MVATRLAGQYRTWSLDGMLFNSVDDETGEIWVVPQPDVEGWDGQPGLRQSGQERIGAHGGIDGIAYFDPRSILLPGWAKFNSRSDAVKGIDRLTKMASDTSALHLLTVDDVDDIPKIAWVRLGDGTKAAIRSEASIDFSILLTAPDARKYSEAEQIVDLILPTGSSGGFFAPFSAPFFSDLPAGGIGEQLAFNDGNFETMPSITVSGPVEDPIITNVSYDQYVGADYNLLAGEFLEFDFVNRSILLNGESSRTGFLSVGSQWWGIRPGSNLIRYRAFNGTNASHMIARYRHAWIG